MPAGEGAKNRPGDSQGHGPRRWLGAGVLALLVGGILLVVPRVAPRSPLTIVVVCALAILTMKLVEHRIRRWLAWWARQQAAREAQAQAKRKGSGVNNPG
jgi:cell division protein FtsW (lipid II flippase)